MGLQETGSPFMSAAYKKEGNCGWDDWKEDFLEKIKKRPDKELVFIFDDCSGAHIFYCLSLLAHVWSSDGI